MHQSDLVRKVAQKAGLTQDQASKAVSAMLDTIKDTLASGEKVVLTGFGTFETRQRQERQGFNPQTRAAMTIPASVVPAFSPGSALKGSVKGNGTAKKGKK